MFPDIRSTNIENSLERYTPNELCMYARTYVLYTHTGYEKKGLFRRIILGAE